MIVPLEHRRCQQDMAYLLLSRYPSHWKTFHSFARHASLKPNVCFFRVCIKHRLSGWKSGRWSCTTAVGCERGKWNVGWKIRSPAFLPPYASPFWMWLVHLRRGTMRWQNAKRSCKDFSALNCMINVWWFSQVCLLDLIEVDWSNNCLIFSFWKRECRRM